MFESCEIANITISPVYMAMIVSLLVSYLLVWNFEDKLSLYILWIKTIVIFYIVYKLSFLVFYPENWSDFLYANGGVEGLLSALIISYVYLAYKTDRLYYVESFMFWAMCFLVFYNFIEFQSLTQWPYLVMMLITLVGTISMYFLSNYFRRILVIFIVSSVAQLVIRMFVYNGEMIFGLSIIEWWLLISLLYVIVMTFRGLRNEVGDTTEANN